MLCISTSTIPRSSLIDVARTHVPLKLDGFDLGYVGGRIYF